MSPFIRPMIRTMIRTMIRLGVFRPKRRPFTLNTLASRLLFLRKLSAQAAAAQPAALLHLAEDSSTSILMNADAIH